MERPTSPHQRPERDRYPSIGNDLDLPPPTALRLGGEAMSLILPAGRQISQGDFDRGVARLRSETAQERLMLEKAEQLARAFVRDEMTSPVAETVMIGTIRERAEVSEYLAAYVVDKLRTLGVVSKDWSTGELEPGA